jgi:hypothetical protein
MLNSTTDRYQQGAIRRVKRAKGFAWEFRYYVVESGERVRKVQTFDSAKLVRLIDKLIHNSSAP